MVLGTMFKNNVQKQYFQLTVMKNVARREIPEATHIADINYSCNK